MSRRRSLSDDEHALWRTFAQSITPLRAPVPARRAKAETKPEAEPESKPRNKPTKDSPVPPRSAKRAGAAAGARPAAAAHARPSAAAPALTPLDRRFKQRVARGRAAIDARIDLHGMTQHEAHAELSRFLRRAQADGARTVIVVTGKGAGRAAKGGADDSPRERGVLRRQVPMWLALPEFRPLVVGFVDAHAGHGGEGALYVRLRRAR
jgi:DNA-nicking Smr family endonuclease